MILVTGASGFLGRTLLHHLVRRPDVTEAQITVLVRDAAAWRAQPDARLASLATVEGTLADVARWRRTLSPGAWRGIFHLAATVRHSRHADDVAATWQVNVHGTQAIAALARDLGARMVLVSSSGTVACSRDPNARPDETAPFAHEAVQHWPYYRSKIAAEQSARERLPTAEQLTIVRPPVLLGPGDTLFRSTSTVVRFLRGRVPFALSGGIAFVDVRDLAPTLIDAMLAPKPPEVLHVPGHAASLRDYFTTLARLSGGRAPRVVLPDALATTIAHASARWARLCRAAHAALEPIAVEMGQHFWGLSSVHAIGLDHRCRPAEHTLKDTIDDLRRRRADCRGRWSGQ